MSSFLARERFGENFIEPRMIIYMFILVQITVYGADNAKVTFLKAVSCDDFGCAHFEKKFILNEPIAPFSQRADRRAEKKRADG